MVTAKSNPNGGGVRKGRACSKSTGNPLEDMQNAKAMQGPSAGATPSRPRTAAAQPIAIPETSTGARRRNGSPRSVQSASPRSSSSYASSTKSSPLRASPSTNGAFYAGAKFSEAPASTSLPKPPSHWTSTIIQHHHHQQKDQFQEISNQLKMLLNIKAWECTKSSCSYGTPLPSTLPSTSPCASHQRHRNETTPQFGFSIFTSFSHYFNSSSTSKTIEQARTVHSLKDLGWYLNWILEQRLTI